MPGYRRAFPIKINLMEIAGEVLIYGNPEVSIPTEDRPLVTFALFAYNQEQFIREAVKGALAQTYSPLEIILSDDCSSDNTFAIMKEMASAYNGVHCIRVIKHQKNLGLVNHLLLIAKLASGRYLIPAAGDDISYPNRAQALSDALAASQATAAFSRHDEIAEDGSLLGTNLLFPTALPGFAAAYKTEFWSSLPFVNRTIIAEDGLALWIIRMRSLCITCVEETLVAYRVLDYSLSSRAEPLSFEEIWQRERQLSVAGKEIIERVYYVFQNAYSPECEVNKSFADELFVSWAYARLLLGFWEAPFYKRFLLALNCCDSRSFKYVVPRLLGRHIFQALRLFLTALRSRKAKSKLISRLREPLSSGR